MSSIEEKMTSLSIEDRALQGETQVLGHMVDQEDVQHLESLWKK